MNTENIHENADLLRSSGEKFMVFNIFDLDHLAISRRDNQFFSHRKFSFGIAEKPYNKTGQQEQNEGYPSRHQEGSAKGKKNRRKDKEITLPGNYTVVLIVHTVMMDTFPVS
jgi:hypothetical protein